MVPLEKSESSPSENALSQSFTIKNSDRNILRASSAKELTNFEFKITTLNIKIAAPVIFSEEHRDRKIFKIALLF